MSRILFDAFGYIPVAYTLTADPGSFALTGTDTLFTRYQISGGGRNELEFPPWLPAERIYRSPLRSSIRSVLSTRSGATVWHGSPAALLVRRGVVATPFTLLCIRRQARVLAIRALNGTSGAIALTGGAIQTSITTAGSAARLSVHRCSSQLTSTISLRGAPSTRAFRCSRNLIRLELIVKRGFIVAAGFNNVVPFRVKLPERDETMIQPWKVAK